MSVSVWQTRDEIGGLVGERGAPHVFAPTQSRTPTGCLALAPPPGGWWTAVRTLSLGPLSVRLPASLGGDTLLSAEGVSLAWPRWTRLRVAVQNPTVAATLDAASLTPHAMRLLLHLNLARLVEPSVCVPANAVEGETGDAEEAPPAEAAADVAAVTDAAAAGDAIMAALPRQLSLTPAAVELAGATLTFALGSIASLDVVLAPGSVLLPAFMADVLGGRVTVTLAAGAAAIADRAAALHTAAGDWTRSPPSTTTVHTLASPALTGRPLAPIALRAETEHGGVAAAGWWTTTGLALREPATAALDFTSALVEGVIGHIHPLLADAVKLEEEDVVRVRLEPSRLHVPCRSVTLMLPPCASSSPPTPSSWGHWPWPPASTRASWAASWEGPPPAPPRALGLRRLQGAKAGAARPAPTPSPRPSRGRKMAPPPTAWKRGRPRSKRRCTRTL